MTPFRAAIPQADLDELADRLARVRFTPELPGGRDVGVSVARVRDLVDRWRHTYDWRTWEARLNAHPQYLARVDGLDVHFLHVRSPDPAAFPLILTHGWPMSVFELLDLVPRLRDAFHLVIPSIPGFGFSSAPGEPGWGRTRIARAWAELMQQLGYDRYGAHGNDIGGAISLELGRLDPAHVAGVHVTQVFSLPSGDPAALDGLGDDDVERLQRSQRFIREKGAYLQLQSTQPQTLAHALADSPVGQLAWSLQLFGPDVDPDYILTNASLYWLTNTAGTAALTGYFEDAPVAPPASPTTFPLGVATFADDVFQSVRRFAERDHANIVSWNTYSRGGHHPAHQVPDMLADDLRRFFVRACRCVAAA